jgi:hypothetical protein
MSNNIIEIYNISKMYEKIGMEEVARIYKEFSFNNLEINKICGV